MYRLTPEDIKILAGSGEGFNVEFKVRVPSKIKELSQVDLQTFSGHKVKQLS